MPKWNSSVWQLNMCSYSFKLNAHSNIAFCVIIQNMCKSKTHKEVYIAAIYISSHFVYMEFSLTRTWQYAVHFLISKVNICFSSLSQVWAKTDLVRSLIWLLIIVNGPSRVLNMNETWKHYDSKKQNSSHSVFHSIWEHFGHSLALLLFGSNDLDHQQWGDMKQCLDNVHEPRKFVWGGKHKGKHLEKGWRVIENMWHATDA